MTCQEVQEHLSAYVDGELPADEARTVLRHLDECAACRDLAEEIRSVARVLSSLPHRPAPGELSDEIRSRLERRMLLAPMGEDAEATSRADRRLSRVRPAVWPRVAAVAASVILGLGILWLAVLPREGLRTPEGPQRVVQVSEEEGTRLAATSPKPRDDFKADGNFSKDSGNRGITGSAETALDHLNAQKPASIERVGTAGASGWTAMEQVRGSTTADNVLTLETDLDPVQAQAELTKVFNDVQWEVAPAETGDDEELRRGVDASAKARGAPDYGRYDQRAAGRQEFVYVGQASLAQVEKLNHDVTRNAAFRVRAEASSGAFASAAERHLAFAPGPSRGGQSKMLESAAGQGAAAASQPAATYAVESGRPGPGAAPRDIGSEPRPTAIETPASGGAKEEASRARTVQRTPAVAGPAEEGQATRREAEPAVAPPEESMAKAAATPALMPGRLAEAPEQAGPPPAPTREAALEPRLADKAEDRKASLSVAEGLEKQKNEKAESQERMVVVVRLVTNTGETYDDTSLRRLDRAAASAEETPSAARQAVPAERPANE